MSKLIIKNGYIKGGSKNSFRLSNLVNYVATRDGVDFVSKRDSPATSKQKILIDDIVKDFPNSKNSFEYADFCDEQTAINASRFISIAIEENFESMSRKKNYVGYIANRPRVEKFEAHGLFTSGDDKIILSNVMKEIANHAGNIWTPIISLKREDATITEFDNVERWEILLSKKAPMIAEQMKIPLDNFRWYAAMHNESHHPHIHMICYSTDPKQGYLSKKSIENIKSDLVKEIFKEQLHEIYQQKTVRRDELKATAEKIFDDLYLKLDDANVANPKLEKLIKELSDGLKSVSGKKVYGFLNPELKQIVDIIVDEVSAQPEIEKAYDLWYEMQNEIYSSYNDDPPDFVPLSKQKEFKSIKNMIIRAVLDMDIDVDIVIQEHENESAPNDEPSQVNNPTPDNPHSPNKAVGVCALKVLGGVARIFENKFNDRQAIASFKVDRKSIRKLRELKESKGQKHTGEDLKIDY